MQKKICASFDANFTTAPVQPGVEWVRPGDVRLRYGLGRSLIYQLIAEGKIRSICLRREGRLNGMRLISASSLRDYIESHAEASQ